MVTAAIRRSALVATSTLFLLSCVGSSVDVAGYFGLKEGSRRKYRFTVVKNTHPVLSQKREEAVTLELVVFAKRRLRDQDVFPVRLGPADQDSAITFFAVDGGGVHAVAVQGPRDVEPRFVAVRRYALKGPLKAGTRWQDDERQFEMHTSGEVTKYSTKTSHSILTMGAVTVAAGNFSGCAKVETQAETANIVTGWKLSRDGELAWYCPDVGLVKRWAHHEGMAGAGHIGYEREDIMELVETLTKRK